MVRWPQTPPPLTPRKKFLMIFGYKCLLCIPIGQVLSGTIAPSFPNIFLLIAYWFHLLLRLHRLSSFKTPDNIAFVCQRTFNEFVVNFHSHVLWQTGLFVVQGTKMDEIVEENRVQKETPRMRGHLAFDKGEERWVWQSTMLSYLVGYPLALFHL